MKLFHLVSAAMIALGATTLFAQGPAGEGPGNKMPMMPPQGFGMQHHSPSENPAPMMMNIAELQNLMNEININKSVSGKIVDIARAFLKSLDENLLQVQKEELNIKEELLKDRPDLQKIQGAVARKSQVFAQIEFSQIKRDLDIKSLLSQDEYDRWKSAMMQKMRQMMPDRQDRCRPDGPGKNPPPQK
jgi:hypothetical protein